MSASTSGSDGKLADVGVAQDDGVSPPRRIFDPPSSLCHEELPVPKASATSTSIGHNIKNYDFKCIVLAIDNRYYDHIRVN